MADPNVNIIVTATDKTKGVLSGIGGALGGLGKVALGVAAGGVAALGAGLALSVKEAMEAQEVNAKLEQVIKATGGAAGITAKDADDLANSLAKVTRFSDETVKSAETVLLRFKGIGKEAFPAATKTALDLATALGIDASSAATMLGKALETPGEGMLRLKAAGVALSDEQIDLIKSMAEAGDMAGAQKMIMDELAKSVGGMAEASGSTFAGQMDILKNSLLNVAEGVGTALLPLLQALLENVIIPIVPYIQMFADGLSALFAEFQRGADAGGILGGAMEVLDNILSEDMIASIWGVIDAVQAFVNDALAVLIPWLQDMIPKAIAFLADVWQTVLLPAIQFVWNFISTVLVPLFMTVVLPILQDIIPVALQFLADVWTKVLKPAIEAVWAWMNGTLMPFLQNVVVPWLQENIPRALQVLSDFWQNVLKPAIQAVWQWMSTVLIPFLQNVVKPWLEKNIPAALETLRHWWEDILLPAITSVWNFINTYLVPIFKTVQGIFETGLKLALEVISGVWRNILLPALNDVYNFVNDYVTPALTWLMDKVVGPLAAALKDDLKAALVWVNEQLQKFKQWLDDIKLPDWLVGHSPTPFEMGIRGITAAMKELNDYALPDFGQGLGRLGLDAVGAAGQVTNYNLTINEAGSRGNVMMDFALLRALAG